MPAAGTRTSSSRIVVSGSLRWPPGPVGVAAAASVAVPRLVSGWCRGWCRGRRSRSALWPSRFGGVAVPAPAAAVAPAALARLVVRRFWSLAVLVAAGSGPAVVLAARCGSGPAVLAAVLLLGRRSCACSPRLVLLAAGPALPWSWRRGPGGRGRALLLLAPVAAPARRAARARSGACSLPRCSARLLLGRLALRARAGPADGLALRGRGAASPAGSLRRRGLLGRTRSGRPLSAGRFASLGASSPGRRSCAGCSPAGRRWRLAALAARTPGPT